MRIQDLEYRTGLDRATIRYYEKEGLITPVRHDNGYRDYSEDDRNQLLKIKLLRQLGLPLGKIKEIRQGSEGLDKALEDQIVKLKHQRDHAQRSVQVCQLIRSDGVTYSDMNADYYLKQLSTMPVQYLSVQAKPADTSYTFRECISQPYHPVRHLFARFFDLVIFSLILVFLQAIILRTGWKTLLINPISPFLALAFVPVEAFFYRFFATTPGKCLFGIEVRHADGSKHSYSTAINRAFCAYRYGWGWGIPIWRLLRLYKSYHAYAENDNEWNDESEVHYQDFGWKQICTWVMAVSICIGGIFLSLHMVNLPKNTNSNLNIKQFSENFNDYWMRLGREENGMNPDGTFVWVENPNTAVIVVMGREHKPFPNLEYKMDNDIVKGFSCTDEFNFTVMEYVVSSRLLAASYALLASQPGEGVETLESFRSELNSLISKAVLKESESVSYSTDIFTVKLSVEFEDCKYNGADMLIVFDEKEDSVGWAKVSYSFELNNSN